MKFLITEQIPVTHENFEQTKNRFKTNKQSVYKHSIVCSVLKHPFSSQEILVEERIPTGSHKENNALYKWLPCF